MRRLKLVMSYLKIVIISSLQEDSLQCDMLYYEYPTNFYKLLSQSESANSVDWQ